MADKKVGCFCGNIWCSSRPLKRLKSGLLISKAVSLQCDLLIALRILNFTVSWLLQPRLPLNFTLLTSLHTPNLLVGENQVQQGTSPHWLFYHRCSPESLMVLYGSQAELHALKSLSSTKDNFHSLSFQPVLHKEPASFHCNAPVKGVIPALLHDISCCIHFLLHSLEIVYKQKSSWSYHIGSSLTILIWTLKCKSLEQEVLVSNVNSLAIYWLLSFVN